MGKVSSQKKKNFSGNVKKSILINASQDKVWRKISNITNLSWLVDVKRTVSLSKRKRGVGSIRNITFDNGNQIEEHVVAWENKKSFSYTAVTGLPLRLYYATISIKSQKKSTVVTWQSYFNSNKMTKKEFNEFVIFMSSFYQASLKNLKLKLEK